MDIVYASATVVTEVEIIGVFVQTATVNADVPMDSPNALDKLLDLYDQLRKLPAADVRYGVKKFHAWRDLALRDVPFGEGDRVAIADGFDGAVGIYKSYGEWMRPGHTGVVLEIDIQPSDLAVYAMVKFDQEWQFWDWGGVKRHNYLLTNEQTTPQDRRHQFMFPVTELRPATTTDKPFTISDMEIAK